MYKVIIADDESLIREGLKFILDWNDAGFEIIGEAGNGNDALSAILMLNPDLVLLDIRMPKLTGIEVIEKARAEGFTGRFIILSGFSDFKYAQAAIKYGVNFYLTKPIDEDELSQAIASIKEELDLEKLQSKSLEQLQTKAKDAVVKDLLCGTYEKDFSDVLLHDLERLDLISDCYQVVIYENFSQNISDTVYNFSEMLQVTNKDNNAFHFVELEHRNVILLKGTHSLNKLQGFLSHYDRIPQKGSPLDSIFLAFGRPVFSIADIPVSYKEALMLIKRRFFCIQAQHTLGYEELPDVSNKNSSISSDTLTHFCELFVTYLQTFNRKKVAETLYDLETFLYSVKNEIQETKLFLTDLYLQIKEQINHIYSTVSVPFPSNSGIIEQIDKNHYLYEIIQFLSEQFEMIMNATGNPSRDSVLDDILYYIEHNYATNIKLETIAPLFGYNSAYLGKIFTKNTGMSFNSYVDSLRIDSSKELLSANKLKVYEIAEKVGYKNVDYFHKKFKKYVGMSPAEYRKTLGILSSEEDME